MGTCCLPSLPESSAERSSAIAGTLTTLSYRPEKIVRNANDLRSGGTCCESHIFVVLSGAKLRRLCNV